MGDLWLLLLQNASSGLLVPEKGTHWLFWGIYVPLFPGLLLRLVILACRFSLSCIQKRVRFCSNMFSLSEIKQNSKILSSLIKVIIQNLIPSLYHLTWGLNERIFLTFRWSFWFRIFLGCGLFGYLHFSLLWFGVSFFGCHVDDDRVLGFCV